MCEIKKELLDLDKTDIAPQLSHLSHSQITELITGYYNKESNYDLVKKFKIKYEPNDLSEIFPLINVEDEICKTCKNHLHRKFHSRISRKSIASNSFCRKCQIKKQIEAIEDEVHEIKGLSSRGIKSILNQCFKYNPYIRESPDYQSPLLLNYIYPLILKNCAIKHDDNTVYGVDHSAKLMPLYSSRMFEEMLVAGIIQLDSSTPTKALVISHSCVFDLNVFEANWTINTEQGFSKIMAINKLNNRTARAKGWVTDWNMEIKNIWLKIVIDECIEFMLITSAQNGYPIGGVDVRNKIKITLKKLLEKYTESRCFTIIWAFCQLSKNCLQDRGVYYKDHQEINSFTSTVFDERCKELLEDDYEIHGMTRPVICPRSKLNKIFFNDILGIKGDAGYYTLMNDFIKK